MTDISDRLEAEITELQAVADRQRKLNDLPVVCRAISPLVTLLEDAHTTIRALTAGSETGERRVLLDVIAEDRAKGLLEKVRRCVVAGRGESAVLVDMQVHLLAGQLAVRSHGGW